MIQVRLLTEEQAIELTGEKFRRSIYFNPVQDNNGNWVITEEEVTLCRNPEFTWVAELPQIEWEKPEPTTLPD